MDGLERILACPLCRGSLAVSESRAECRACKASFERRGGRLDLRLPAPKAVSLSFEVGRPLTAIEVRPLAKKGSAAVDFTGVTPPVHLSPELLSWFPRAQGAESLMLDLGCGTGLHREVVEHARFRYVGIDHDEASGGTLLADAQALPFKDESFEFVLSVAVLEHIRFPFVALAEAHRVLKPGGRLVGTVAFLEPFHGNSYYHHTHLGALGALEASGFKVEMISVMQGWSALVSLANLALFPRLPLILARLLVWPLDLLHRIWWWLGRLRDPRATDSTRVLLSAGAFAFVATKAAER